MAEFGHRDRMRASSTHEFPAGGSTRMVPVGGHFSSSPASVASAQGDSRPAGRRFAQTGPTPLRSRSGMPTTGTRFRSAMTSGSLLQGSGERPTASPSETAQFLAAAMSSSAAKRVSTDTNRQTMPSNTTIAKKDAVSGRTSAALSPEVSRRMAIFESNFWDGASEGQNNCCSTSPSSTGVSRAHMRSLTAFDLPDLSDSLEPVDFDAVNAPRAADTNSSDASVTTVMSALSSTASQTTPVGSPAIAAATAGLGSGLGASTAPQGQIPPQGQPAPGGFVPLGPSGPTGQGPRSGGRTGATPPPRKRGMGILSTVLIVVGVVLLLVAAGLFIRSQLGYREAQSTYDNLAQYAVVSDNSGDSIPNVDFDALKKINPEVVGWIYVPGTPINYPVVQTDNNETYLTKLFDGKGNGSGSIFMDTVDTAPGMTDQQTTIYGHHMNDGSMFKYIDNTRDQAIFDTVKTVYYITPDTTYVLKPLFTARVEDTYVEARQPNFEDVSAFHAYLKEFYGQAEAVASDAKERIDSADRVLTLVTCAGEIIPRTTRAAMVLTVEQTISR